MILGLGNTIPSDSVRQGLGGGGGGGFTNTYSLAFDGVDDFVKTSLDGTSTGGILPASDSDIELTISFWFYMDGSQSLKGIFQWANQIIDLTPTLLVNTDGASIRTFVDGSYRHTSGITMNAWHHYAITRTASTNTWQGYIDGVSAFTANDGGTLNSRASATNFYFGVGYNGYLNGKIDEAAFWNSVQDVTSIYNSGTPNDLTSLNPTAWYRNGDNGSYKSPQWLIPNNSNKDKVSNYSFDFDGVDDYVDFGNPTSLQITTDLSVSFWFKGSSTADQAIVAKDTLGLRCWGIWNNVFGAGNNLQFYIFNSNSLTEVQTSANYNDGNWHNVVCVFKPSTYLRIYVDGVLDGENTTSIPATIDNDLANLTVGAILSSGSPIYEFEGNVDEVAIWNSDQSANVASIYNSGTPTTLPSGTVAHYKMGEEANFTDNWLVNNSVLSNYSTRSFNFDGVDDYVNLGNNADFNTNDTISVSVWFKTSDDTTPTQQIFSKTFYRLQIQDYFGGSRIVWAVYHTSGSLKQIVASGTEYADGQWHHALCVYESNKIGGMTLHVDGVLIGSADTSTQIHTSTNPLLIGVKNTSSQQALDGSVDELAFWTNNQSTNISTIYNSGTPADISSLSPVSWYRMGEDATFSTNWSLPDNGSASNTGTSANMTIADLEGDAPNYTGGGLSNNMTIEDRVGDAPNSTNNALSYNMTESDRETDVPT